MALVKQSGLARAKAMFLEFSYACCQAGSKALMTRYWRFRRHFLLARKVARMRARSSAG